VATTEPTTAFSVIGRRVVYLGAKEESAPAGLYHDHGANSGESQMFIMIVYGTVWKKVLMKSVAIGMCQTAQEDPWYFVLMRPWLLGTLLVAPALLWGGMSGVGAWRRRGRQGAGRCSACGYDLRASPERCPECGTAVADRKNLHPSAGP
jgi:hypothetical protein